MKLGLIGYPISRSKSPELFRKLHPEGGNTYSLIEEPVFGTAWERFIEEFDAVNVTAPFKEDALKAADLAEDNCLRIGAANVLVRHGGVVKAFNTDYDAVRALLDKYAPGARKAVVLGCGGAGKAAAAACLDAGMELTVVNRTEERARKFLCDLKSPGCRAASPGEACSAVAEADVVVDTLPVAAPYSEGLDFGGKVLIEACYSSPKYGPSDCGRYVSGMEWLEEQARRGFKLMTGKD